METQLSRWYYMKNNNDSGQIYTCDTWIIPEAGANIWCSFWEKKQIIKPYGDGMHVYVKNDVYHCDELMGKLSRIESEGHKWGIEGVTPKREQFINGHWTPVKIAQ